MTLAEQILNANHKGYTVKFKREYGGQRVTCTHNKEQTSASTVVLEQDFNDHQASELIIHNIEKHKRGRKHVGE